MKKDYPFTSTGMLPKLKTFPASHEYEWDKVCRERKEKHPKFLGGQVTKIPKELSLEKN